MASGSQSPKLGGVYGEAVCALVEQPAISSAHLRGIAEA